MQNNGKFHSKSFMYLLLDYTTLDFWCTWFSSWGKLGAVNLSELLRALSQEKVGLPPFVSLRPHVVSHAEQISGSHKKRDQRAIVRCFCGLQRPHQKGEISSCHPFQPPLLHLVLFTHKKILE